MRKGQVLFQCINCSFSHAVNGKNAFLFKSKCPSCKGKMVRSKKITSLIALSRKNSASGLEGIVRSFNESFR